MINNIPVMKLVAFRRLTERSRSTFAKNLQKAKKPKSEDGTDGGNYWIRSLSGLNKAFKSNDNKHIQQKIDQIMEVFPSARKKTVKDMYKRNLEILYGYTDFDFSIWQPSTDLKFPTKSKLILSINDLPIQVIPSHVFSFYNNEEATIGGIWFVIWIKGFKDEDLDIFAEALFEYLSIIYSENYVVDPNNCIIVDAISKNAITYMQVSKKGTSSSLNNTVSALKKYLQ